jgi:hypothetical protein
VEVDPGAKERLRDMLTGIDEQLAGGRVASGDEAMGLVRRRTIASQLLAHGVARIADRP